MNDAPKTMASLKATAIAFSVTAFQGHAFAASLLAALLAAISVGPACAAGNANAKIMLHVLSPTSKNPCERAENIPPSCASYNVSELLLYPDVFFVYALVVNGSQAEGIGGASFGIAYNHYQHPGVEVWTWTNCGHSELRTNGWPESEGGNTIFFETPGNCQTGGSSTLGAVASLGYFYCGAYTPDSMRLTPHPGMNVATVTNCASEPDTMYHGTFDCTSLGRLGFGPSQFGNNPCNQQGICFLNPNCTFDGPTSVIPGQTNIRYANNRPGPNNWWIVGNGTIVGPLDKHEVFVNAGAAGSFELRTTMDWSGIGEHTVTCRKTVAVEEDVPVIPTTWTRVKSLVRE